MIRGVLLFIVIECLFRYGNGITVTIGAFLDTTNSKEHIYDHAYRMAFAEFMEQTTFDILNSIEAEDLINKYVIDNNHLQGTIGNITVNLKFVEMKDVYDYDSKTEQTAQAGKKFQAFVDNHSNDLVLFAGGYSTSYETIKANWCKTANIPLVTGGAATSSIYKDNIYAYGLLSPISKLAESSLKLLNSSDFLTKPVKIVLLWEDAAHGREYRDTVNKIVATDPENYQVVFNSSFPLREYKEPSQFRPLFDQIEALNDGNENSGTLGKPASTVLLVDAHSEDYILMQQELATRDNTFEAISYGARGVDTDDVAEILLYTHDESSLLNISAGLWWSPGIVNEKSMKFVSAWRKHETLMWLQDLDELEIEGSLDFAFSSTSKQLSPSWFGAAGYEALRVLLTGIQNTESFNNDGILHALAATNLTSILPGGKIEFNQHGQMENDFTMAQNQYSGRSDSVNHIYPLIVYPEVASGAPFAKYEGYTHTKPECTSEWFQSNRTDCDSSNTFEIVYYWLDRDNNRCWPTSGGEPCDCIDTNQILPQDTPYDCKYVNGNSGEAAVISALAFVGVSIASILILVLLLSWRNERLEGGHKPYLIVIGAVSIWGFLGTLTLIGENSEVRCKLRAWNIVLSTAAIISALFGRVYYWYKVWLNPSKETLNISVRKLAIPPLGIFLLFVILVGIWFGVNSEFVENDLVRIPTETEPYKVEVCRYFTSIAIPVTCGILLVLVLLITFLFAYQAKDVDGKYFESWYLWIISFNILFILTILAILLGLAQLGTVTNSLFLGIALFWSALGLVMLSYFPRLSAVYGVNVFSENRNSMGTTTAAQTTDSQNVVAKYIHGKGRRDKLSSTQDNFTN